MFKNNDSKIFLKLNLYVQKSVVVFAPISPHPVRAVTAGPVDVLGVGPVGPVQEGLHALLDPDDLARTLGPSVLEQTDEVGVHPVLEVVVRVGSEARVGGAVGQELLPVPEVDGPEAVVASDHSEHLVVFPKNSK